MACLPCLIAVGSFTCKVGSEQNIFSLLVNQLVKSYSTFYILTVDLMLPSWHYSTNEGLRERWTYTVFPYSQETTEVIYLIMCVPYSTHYTVQCDNLPPQCLQEVLSLCKSTQPVSPSSPDTLWRSVDRSKAVLPMPAGQLARCTADTYVGVATGGVATEFRIHLHLPLLSCQWSLQVQNKHTHCKFNIGLPVSLDHPAPSSTCHLPVLPLCILWVAPPHTPRQRNQSIVST